MELGFDTSRPIWLRKDKRIYAVGNRAVSVIPLSGAREAEALLRRREALLGDLGDSPWLNLPRSQRLVERDGAHVLVEEMLLAREDGPNDTWERELIEGLRAMHGAGWAHLDLKPEHLMWAGGHWRIHDFDGAMRIGERIRFRDVTYAYAPPDVFWHDRAEASDDLYAAALMLYRRRNGMLLPFEHGSERLATLFRNLAVRTPVPREWGEPARIFFTRALAHSRRKRFRSTEEFIDAWARMGAG